MDIKNSVKLRREARIRELLSDNDSEVTRDSNDQRPLPAISAIHIPEVRQSSGIQHSSLSSAGSAEEMERDPEKLWKQGHRGWYDHTTEPVMPPRKYSFGAGLLRRLTASVLIFGAIWGIFSIHEPWAIRTQGYIIQGLNQEMNFQAAQAWYEEYFGGTPSFIPIFGQDEQDTTKVNARTSLIPPLQGNLVQAFAVDFKGVLIAPLGDSLSVHEVKSVEAGRVLEVKQQADSSISVLIQHTGSRTAIYSRLSATTLKVNDWVEGGDVVGTLPPVQSDGEQSALYFMLKDGDRSVDPTDVITFD